MKQGMFLPFGVKYIVKIRSPEKKNIFVIWMVLLNLGKELQPKQLVKLKFRTFLFHLPAAICPVLVIVTEHVLAVGNFAT